MAPPSGGGKQRSKREEDLWAAYEEEMEEQEHLGMRQSQAARRKRYENIRNTQSAKWKTELDQEIRSEAETLRKKEAKLAEKQQKERQVAATELKQFRKAKKNPTVTKEESEETVATEHPSKEGNGPATLVAPVPPEASRQYQSEENLTQAELVAKLQQENLLLLTKLGEHERELEAKKRREESSCRIQGALGGKQARAQFHVRKTIEEDTAARKAQAVVRGCEVRKVVEKELAAEQIQAGVVAYCGRQEVARESTKDDAAAQIQSALSAHTVRQQVKKEIDAVQIQSMMRGADARRHVEELHAVERIQAGIRGYETRRGVASMNSDSEHGGKEMIQIVNLMNAKLKSLRYKHQCLLDRIPIEMLHPSATPELKKVVQDEVNHPTPADATVSNVLNPGFVCNHCNKVNFPGSTVEHATTAQQLSDEKSWSDKFTEIMRATSNPRDAGDLLNKILVGIHARKGTNEYDDALEKAGYLLAQGDIDISYLVKLLRRGNAKEISARVRGALKPVLESPQSGGAAAGAIYNANQQTTD